MTGLRVALLVAAAGVAGGCFDVSGNQQSPLLIDDFDSGGVFPADHHFDQWRCGEFNPKTKQGCQCGYDDTTYRSYPYSIQLAATVVDVLNSAQDTGGAQLYTQADVPEDLSRMNEIVFSAKLDTSDKDLDLNVEIHCSLAQVTGDSHPSDLFLTQQRHYWPSSDWQGFTMRLSDFTRGSAYWPFAGGLTACLEQVDGIHFSVNTNLIDGQTGSFVLHLDDVYLQ